MVSSTMKSMVRGMAAGGGLLSALIWPGAALADSVPLPSPGSEMMQVIQDKDKVLAPKEEKAPPVIEQEKKKSARTSGISDRKVLVKKFEIRGNTLLTADALHSVTAPAEGKELTIDDIWNVADLITAKYRDEGYLLANAYVPPQQIDAGVVVIMVMEGRIASVKVEGNKSYSSAFVERHVANAVNDYGVKEETLERDILLLNDYQSLTVKAALKAGKEPGTTDMIIGVKDKFPVSGSISYDSYGLSSVSKDRLNASLNVGNLLTSGDLLMLRGMIGLDTVDVTRMSYGRAEYLIPVGGYGTQIGGYFANSIYNAGQTLTPLNLNGRAVIGGVYITHPVLKKRDETLSVRLGAEYINATQDLLNQPNTKDHIRKFVLNVPYTMTDRFLGRNYFALGYAAGMGGILDGTTNAGVNGSRPTRVNASNNFGKLNGDFMRIQKLPGYNHLIIRASGQYTPDDLLIEEQFMIGGQGTVRGYDLAQAAGDSGYYFSAELSLSPFRADDIVFGQKVGDTFKIALFVDHGGVFNNNAQSGERESQYLTSIGGGVRLYGGQTFSFKLDCGIPKINGKFNASHNKTTVEVALSF